MRVKKSFLNAISNSLILIVRAILLFVVRIVIIRQLGKVYLGVDSLFTNLLSVLSIADLGISTAINFSLYKPLSEKDYKKVSALMTLYKKIYMILGIIVLVIGFVIFLFLGSIVKENIENLKLIYFIYLFTTISMYFLSYKNSLLIADQNNYKITFIDLSFHIALGVFRIAFLYIAPSLLIYALIQFIITILQRAAINLYITKSYKQVNFNSKEKVTKKEQKEIFRDVKSMFLNKIGNYLVTGTDNIIISASKNLGVGIVGVYANYYSITNMMDSIIFRGLSGITASFGDLAVNAKEDAQEEVFDIINFVSYLIYGLFSVGFYFVLTPVIKSFFGGTFGLTGWTLIVICLNFYFLGMIRTLDVIKEATGNYVKDRYANIIQAIINIVFSIVLCKYMGLLGVVLATLISYILVPLWNKPYVTYKYTFKKMPFKYYLKELTYFVLLLFITFICSLIFSKISIENNVLSILLKIVIITITYIAIMILVFSKTKEYKYIKDLVYKVIKKKNFS